MTGGASPEKQARLARLYDDDRPAYATRFATLLLRHLRPTAAARRRDWLRAAATSPASWPGASMEPHHRLRRGGGVRQRGARQDGRRQDLRAPINVAGGGAARASRRRRIRRRRGVEPGRRRCRPPGRRDGGDGARARARRHGGDQPPLRGTWGEFLDLFRDVLRESRKPRRRSRSIATSPACPTRPGAAGSNRSGLANVGIEVERWEILFKSSREFLFAPLFSGRCRTGSGLQAAATTCRTNFFFTKEAIDYYFQGRPFAITVVGAVAWGNKRPARHRSRPERRAAQLLRRDYEKHDWCGHHRRGRARGAHRRGTDCRHRAGRSRARGRNRPVRRGSPPSFGADPPASCSPSISRTSRNLTSPSCRKVPRDHLAEHPHAAAAVRSPSHRLAYRSR